MASIGVVTMDRCSNFLQVVSTPIQFVGNAITAKDLVIREALENTKENGWSKVQILSDAKAMVNMI
ncbi:hypothetical protein RND71_031462 [Anisodus tanguticus]|uniref:RNase H type-1 domain-containing protein n=1 Tax=Anisodus tanguticus TaxID=243964 RepID=A0AAE1RDM5_9SOLA|nr:hypothetical protein RND71_031462 [Anisodus tanguticus]